MFRTALIRFSLAVSSAWLLAGPGFAAPVYPVPTLDLSRVPALPSENLYSVFRVYSGSDGGYNLETYRVLANTCAPGCACGIGFPFLPPRMPGGPGWIPGPGGFPFHPPHPGDPGHFPGYGWPWHHGGGGGASVSNVPEPGTFGLLFFSGVALIALGRLRRH